MSAVKEGGGKLINKVADITIIFWLIKIISTTVGEASADFFGSHFGSKAMAIAFILLVVSIIIQIKFKRYVPWMYWTVIILVAVFGTMFADAVHHLGIAIQYSTAIFTAMLLLSLWVWYAFEKTLDVHSIYTTRREIFYWTVIFFTFALGTAAGDLFASGLHLGFLEATLIFAAIIVVIPSLLYLCRVNSIFLFWVTYILTRPLGASAADLLGKPVSHGGFGLGDGTTSLISFAVTLILIVWLSISHKKAMLFEEQVSEDANNR
jgi:uncharacterized membrane-anchored protein